VKLRRVLKWSASIILPGARGLVLRRLLDVDQRVLSQRRAHESNESYCSLRVRFARCAQLKDVQKPFPMTTNSW
jgi:hypothetical protein